MLQENTKETANRLMPGREARLPDSSQYDLISEPETDLHEFAAGVRQRMRTGYQMVKIQRAKIRGERDREPLQFRKGDLVSVLGRTTDHSWKGVG